MSTTDDNPSASGTGTNNNNVDQKQTDNQMFECNICLDTAKDAVISMCGHLFCWPCLYQWLETRPNRQQCPVCKAAISRDKVIPLYGRGSSNQTDPRDKVPPRPHGQRSEPETSSGFAGGLFGDGGAFQVSFGIGTFPFTLFTSTFNLGDQRPRPPQMGDEVDGDLLSQAFLWLAAVFIVWILFT